MAFKIREELVGKRFLSVKTDGKLKVSKISEWEWRSGFVRAVSTKDYNSSDITVLVEFDDAGWKSREYIKVFSVFQLFLVENSLAWVERQEPNISPHEGKWPALSFKPIVDKADLFQQTKQRPVEFLSDHFIDIVDEKEISLYKEGDENRISTVLSNLEVKKWVKRWTDYQDGQKILLTTPTVLLGYRVEVYRTEGTTQWYTAVIKAYNHTNKSLTLTDDTVLEEHNEDPTLIQMHLIGDGVVDSILNGVDVGVAQRRRPRSTVIKQSSKDSSLNNSSSRSSQNTNFCSTSKSSTASARNLNSPSTTTASSITSSNTTSSSSHTSNSFTSSACNKSGTNKGRTSGTATSVASSPISANCGIESIAKDNSNSKGQNHRSSKTLQKRKSEKSEPPTKPAKKTGTSKCLKKSSSTDSVEEEQSPPVCSQTCNVIVERIEEENKRQTQTKDRSKGKPPRLRDKVDTVKKSGDFLNVVTRNSIEPEEEFTKASDTEAQKTASKDNDEVNEEKYTNLNKVATKDSENSTVDSANNLNVTPSNATENPLVPAEVSDKKEDTDQKCAANLIESPVQKTSTEINTSDEDNKESWQPKSDLVHSSEIDKNSSSGLKSGVQNNDSLSVSPKKGSKQAKVNKKKDNNKQSQPASPTVSSENKVDNDSMYYKKQMLRAGGLSPNNSTSNISEGINVNISLTDQIAKRNKGHISVNGDGKISMPETTVSSETRSPNSSAPMHHPSHMELSANLSRFQETVGERGDRQSAFSSVPRSNLSAFVNEDRADSRASDSQLNMRHEDKRPSSRLDEIRSVRSSPGSSPLIVDKHDTVHPYRDPELMRKNNVQSNVPSILTTQQSPFPSVVHPPPVLGVTAPSQSSGAATVAFPPGVPGLPARSLLSSLPYSTAHHLPPSHHLSLPHGYTVDAMAAVRHQQLILQQQQQQQQQLMAAGYPSTHPSTHLATLEAIWQRKLQSNTLPQHWALSKNPEALLPGDYAVIQRDHILQLEQERERREHHDRREAERLEQERREKERKEQLERERIEKAEREKQEQERLERERLERERMDKERRERERKEWEEHKQNQERILHPAEVDQLAAVDQHFAASLNKLANQKGITNMFSLARGRPGTSFVPKTEPHQAHIPIPGMTYRQDTNHPFDPHKEDMIKRESDITVSKPANDNKPPFVAYHNTSGYPAGPPHSQKPVFNLYGFPSSPSTISTEQLKQRGLIPDSRNVSVKEEMLDKKRSFSPHLMSNHSQPLPAGFSKVDIKREPAHSSVIVKRENKIKMEVPMAAHSHHNSPSSSSPRPQHPRPAHTPEHRPDRPLSSSASPASGIHSHLHHSNTATSASAHLPINHSIGFRPSDPHISSRSHSPYTSAASQAHMPQPLDYCKSSMSSKSKAIDNVQQQQTAVHSTYQTQASVSIASASSLAYNNSLIQQGLVPNPIYSHPSTQPSPQHHHHHNPADPSIRHSSPTVVPGSRASSQPSPTAPNNNKRKSGSKDSYNNVQQKRPKSHTPDAPASTSHHTLNPSMSIPVTTPQILSNPSPYTTTNSSVFHQPHAAASVSTTTASTSSISPAVSSSSTPLHPSLKTGFLDSFRSFVENTVQEAFQQNEKKEAAERCRNTESNNKPKVTSSPTDTRIQPLNSNVSTGYVNYRQEENTPQLPASSLSDSYDNRIMETINRVANNQMDTDSDTLSASSPPLQIKPSERNSPLNKSNNSSGSSHPHHMKKAWLQRHDEDKKSETPVFSNAAEEDSNSSLSHTKDIISCVENSSLTHGQESNSVSPANVVVTLPNGNIGDLNHHDESTSSASEAETQSPSKVFGPKKRIKQRKSGGTGSTTTKKAKTETEIITSNTPVIVSTSFTSNTTSATSTSTSTGNKKKTSTSSRRSKNEKETKTKDEQAVKKDEPSTLSSPKPIEDHPEPPKEEKNSKTIIPTSTQITAVAAVSRPIASSSPHSPHSERSNASPALSESNTASSVSSSSSSSNTATNSTALPKMLNSNNSKENKDKKKRKGKDNKKSSSFNKPLVKQSVQTLKRTMAHFIQDGSCSEVTPKLTKCRECKMTPVQRSKKQPNIFCRFYAFRRLRYNPRGIVKIEGFSQLSDADPDDIEPWLPQYPIEEPYLDVESSKFIIAKVGDKFCELVEQEREAKSWAGEDVSIVWKRAVMGVREMCDVCDTTLFNMHWVCSKCGFVVCLDCYKARVKEGKKPLSEDKWLTCSSNRQAHDVSEMMLTQIIPSDALWELGRLIHDIRFKWSIPSNCPCPDNVENSAKSVSKNGINQQLLHAVNNHTIPNGIGGDIHNTEITKSKKHSEPFDSYNPATTSSPLSILAEVASMDSESNRDKVDAKRKADKTVVPGDELLEGDKKGCSTLRELLTKTARKSKASNDKKTKKGSGTSTLNDIIQSFVEKSCMDVGTPFKFLHYTPRLGGWKRELPIICHNLTETSVLYPDVPHSWLCDGRLLRLHDAHHKGNLQIFQDQWKRGQPVLVSCANKRMNVNMWKPEIFSKEFGHIKNEVVNCRTGDVIIGHTMSDFWDGFQSVDRRPLDSNGEPILLKLKDWPPGDDFSELLPSRFQDLMQALPLPEYTHRTGKFNLASRLPDFLVRPDLGPKMYNAYGSSQFPKEATTNLHLDISDAVNIMVYVGIPGERPAERKSHEEAAVKAIDDADCDSITKKRVREVNEIPGALWHIYDAHDADKIRDFLNKVAKERGEIIENDHDAIHDQSWYIDKELSDRLYDEYGVQGYTIVQCHGDAIFIPAGAPHQVRNLHSCVKVAEDFVSPEHLNHCFRLTQEFRQLSDAHSNHEDKLQVKNIIYHAVKDAVAVLREHDPKDD